MSIQLLQIRSAPHRTLVTKVSILKRMLKTRIYFSFDHNVQIRNQSRSFISYADHRCPTRTADPRREPKQSQKHPNMRLNKLHLFINLQNSKSTETAPYNQRRSLRVRTVNRDSHIYFTIAFETINFGRELISISLSATL